MKIGIVCYPTYGGSGVLATELGKALALQGNEVHFITYDQPVRLNDLPSNIYYHEVRVSDYPLFDYPPYELVLTSKLADVVKHEGLDILHVHYAIPHASAAYMAKKMLADEGIHIPFVTTLHGTDITLVGRDSSFIPVVTFAINHSDAVTAVSHSLKEDTLKYFDIKQSIDVVHNFICSDYYTTEVDKSYRSTFALENERILVHVSNFRKVKRVEDVIKVFQKVREKLPAKLLMVGDGPERHGAEELCRKQPFCSDVKFLGKSKSVDRVLSISDLFVLTSETESFGLAALEAMACGVPVASTNTGGIPEVNIHEFSGLLSNVGDIEDMAKNAVKILAQDSVLNMYKQNAKLQANKFDIAKILPAYQEIYDRVLGKSIVPS
ncbi:MAG: N-acetyl-alpha-D-glucosaminyl L-malate synthase BshA [Flavobacteriales bacterium]|nr:N-acetyl-alpha-D-glucosaminyl L-malate synthase BshA [Flavobacteriales bacterium]